ncbi:MAG: penicillin-binding transpeptidase domain-containing protein [Streptosporangiaceae bacterium]
MSRVLPRSARVRVAAVAAAAALLAIGVAVGLGSPQPSAEPTVQAFLLEWENGQYRAAAAQTTGDPAVVAREMSDVFQQLDADDLTLGLGTISQHGDAATARFNATVNLGPGGAAWNYQGSFALRKLAAGWKVTWSPAVIVPGLRSGLRMAVLTTSPPRAALLDSAGSPLAQQSPAYEVGVQPGRLAQPEATAAGLAKLTGLDSGQVLDEIQVAPAADFLELVTLKPSAYQRMSGGLSRIPGLIIKKVQLRLSASIASAVSGSVGTETSQVLRDSGAPYRPGATVGLSGLEQAFQRTLVGTPTTEVVTEDQAGQVVSVLKRWPGAAGTPVRTTINGTIQAAANQAAGSLPESTAIVAVRPANGQVLAVADHVGHGMPALQPLDGRYQPGQAFTIVSAAALLTDGVQLNNSIPCNPVNPVGGETFTNIPRQPDLGPQPQFLTDFAHGCQTAFAGLSLRLSATSLAAAESGFGLGAPWQLPRPLTGFAGSMQSPADVAELAADSIGSGSVLVSPLQAALMAAMVASGTWHSPSVVISPADPGLAPRTRFGPQVVQNLRTLMRATVANGAGQDANVAGAAVYGQVGTAPLGGAPGKWVSWFVGFRAGVAFAAVEVTTSPASSAAGLAGQFLRGFRSDS